MFILGFWVSDRLYKSFVGNSRDFMLLNGPSWLGEGGFKTRICWRLLASGLAGFRVLLVFPECFQVQEQAAERLSSTRQVRNLLTCQFTVLGLGWGLGLRASLSVILPEGK